MFSKEQIQIDTRSEQEIQNLQMLIRQDKYSQIDFRTKSRHYYRANYDLTNRLQGFNTVQNPQYVGPDLRFDQDALIEKFDSDQHLKPFRIEDIEKFLHYPSDGDIVSKISTCLKNESTHVSRMNSEIPLTRAMGVDIVNAIESTKTFDARKLKRIISLLRTESDSDKFLELFVEDSSANNVMERVESITSVYCIIIAYITAELREFLDATEEVQQEHYDELAAVNQFYMNILDYHDLHFLGEESRQYDKGSNFMGYFDIAYQASISHIRDSNVPELSMSNEELAHFSQGQTQRNEAFKKLVIEKQCRVDGKAFNQDAYLASNAVVNKIADSVDLKAFRGSMRTSGMAMFGSKRYAVNALVHIVLVDRLDHDYVEENSLRAEAVKTNELQTSQTVYVLASSNYQIGGPVSQQTKQTSNQHTFTASEVDVNRFEKATISMGYHGNKTSNRLKHDPKNNLDGKPKKTIQECMRDYDLMVKTIQDSSPDLQLYIKHFIDCKKELEFLKIHKSKPARTNELENFLATQQFVAAANSQNQPSLVKLEKLTEGRTFHLLDNEAHSVFEMCREQPIIYPQIVATVKRQQAIERLLGGVPRDPTNYQNYLMNNLYTWQLADSLSQQLSNMSGNQTIVKRISTDLTMHMILTKETSLVDQNVEKRFRFFLHSKQRAFAFKNGQGTIYSNYSNVFLTSKNALATKIRKFRCLIEHAAVANPLSVSGFLSMAINFRQRDWLSRYGKAAVDLFRASPDAGRALENFKERLFNGVLNIDGKPVPIVTDFFDSDDWRTFDFISRQFNSESEIFYGRLPPNPIEQDHLQIIESYFKLGDKQCLNQGSFSQANSKSINEVADYVDREFATRSVEVQNSTREEMTKRLSEPFSVYSNAKQSTLIGLDIDKLFTQETSSRNKKKPKGTFQNRHGNVFKDKFDAKKLTLDMVLLKKLFPHAKGDISKLDEAEISALKQSKDLANSIHNEMSELISNIVASGKDYCGNLHNVDRMQGHQKEMSAKIEFMQIYRDFISEFLQQSNGDCNATPSDSLISKLKKRLEGLYHAVHFSTGDVSLDVKSIQKSYLMRSFRSHMQQHLGEEYSETDDLKNLVSYAMSFGSTPAVVKLVPKAHTTGMRLISVLSLNLSMLTSSVEAMINAFNQEIVKEDSTGKAEKFDEVLRKAQEFQKALSMGHLVYAIEGDYSKFNLNINPNDLLSLFKRVIKTVYGQDTALLSVVDAISAQFSRKILVVPMKSISKAIDLFLDREKMQISDRGMRHIKERINVDKQEAFIEFIDNLIRQYLNENGKNKTYKGNFTVIQNSSFLEGILTNMAAMLSSQSMKMFHYQIVKEMEQRCKDYGVEFCERESRDHAQTSDDVLMFVRFRITDITKLKTEANALMLVQEYIDKIGEKSTNFLQWDFKAKLFQPRKSYQFNSQMFIMSSKGQQLQVATYRTMKDVQSNPLHLSSNGELKQTHAARVNAQYILPKHMHLYMANCKNYSLICSYLAGYKIKLHRTHLTVSDCFGCPAVPELLFIDPIVVQLILAYKQSMLVKGEYDFNYIMNFMLMECVSRKGRWTLKQSFKEIQLKKQEAIAMLTKSLSSAAMKCNASTTQIREISRLIQAFSETGKAVSESPSGQTNGLGRLTSHLGGGRFNCKHTLSNEHNRETFQMYLTNQTQIMMSENNIKEMIKTIERQQRILSIYDISLTGLSSVMNESYIESDDAEIINEQDLLHSVIHELTGITMQKHVTKEEFLDMVLDYLEGNGLKEQKRYVAPLTVTMMRSGIQKPLQSFIFPRQTTYTLAEGAACNQTNTIITGHFKEGKLTGTSLSKPFTQCEDYVFKNNNEVMCRMSIRNGTFKMVSNATVAKWDADWLNRSETYINYDGYLLTHLHGQEKTFVGPNMNKIQRFAAKTGRFPKTLYRIEQENIEPKMSERILVIEEREFLDDRMANSLNKLKEYSQDLGIIVPQVELTECEELLLKHCEKSHLMTMSSIVISQPEFRAEYNRQFKRIEKHDFIKSLHFVEGDLQQYLVLTALIMALGISDGTENFVFPEVEIQESNLDRLMRVLSDNYIRVGDTEKECYDSALMHMALPVEMIDYLAKIKDAKTYSYFNQFVPEKVFYDAINDSQQIDSCEINAVKDSNEYVEHLVQIMQRNQSLHPILQRMTVCKNSDFAEYMKSKRKLLRAGVFTMQKRGSDPAQRLKHSFEFEFKTIAGLMNQFDRKDEANRAERIKFDQAYQIKNMTVQDHFANHRFDDALKLLNCGSADIATKINVLADISIGGDGYSESYNVSLRLRNQRPDANLNTYIHSLYSELDLPIDLENIKILYKEGVIQMDLGAVFKNDINRKQARKNYLHNRMSQKRFDEIQISLARVEFAKYRYNNDTVSLNSTFLYPDGEEPIRNKFFESEDDPLKKQVEKVWGLGDPDDDHDDNVEQSENADVKSVFDQGQDAQDYFGYGSENDDDYGDLTNADFYTYT